MASDSTELKREAARFALAEVRSGMLLGLGTGSTASIFVELLGAALRDGTLGDIRAVCTSAATESLAAEWKIALVDLATCGRLDVAIDGADEIDSQLRLIKGRGGALLREKIVEQAAERFIVIADHSKMVERLGVGLFPVEVVRFAAERIRLDLLNEAITGVLRLNGGKPFLTDEGHYLLDLTVPTTIEVPELHSMLKRRAGVVESGYFGHEATEAFIAGVSEVSRLRRPAPSSER